MKCKRCGDLPHIPDGPKEVLLVLPTDTLREKIVGLVEKLSYDYYEAYQLVKVSVREFKTFLQDVRAVDVLSSLELDKIACIPLDQSSAPTFSHFANVRPLGTWLSILEQEDYLDLLADDRLTMYFQPVLDSKTLEIVGFELLARGLKRDGSVIEPTALFSFARKTDTLFYLDRRCRELAIDVINSHELSGYLFFINFSPATIYDPRFCLATTLEAAKRAGVNPSRLVFEVVETEKVQDVKHLGSILNVYRTHGFSVALDDLGAGYSGLNVLVEIRPNMVKVSRDIVGGIDSDELKSAVFDGVVHLARKLGIAVVAEGVETIEEFRRVRESVDFVQGFLFGAPSPRPTFQPTFEVQELRRF